MKKSEQLQKERRKPDLTEKDNSNFEAEFKELVGMTIEEFQESADNHCSSEIAEYRGKEFAMGTSAYTGWWDVYKINKMKKAEQLKE